VVFGRGHQSKIWIMELDGSNQRQLTHGESYDDHPSLYPDLRHVLCSEFTSSEFKPTLGAKLIKLDIYTGRATWWPKSRAAACITPRYRLTVGRLGSRPTGSTRPRQWYGTTGQHFMHEISKGGAARFVSLGRLWAQRCFPHRRQEPAPPSVHLAGWNGSPGKPT
jgi:hypothetical protein